MKSENFDPYYIAEVLSDLLSRQYGRSIVIELSKKEDTQNTAAGTKTGGAIRHGG